MILSPRIFLCHVHEDKEKISQIRQRLSAMGLSPWKDSEDLPPGQEWQRLIMKTLKESDFVLVCCSQLAIRREGYFQREIREALEVAKEKSPGQTYLIPARLEECEHHELLTNYHQVDLYRFLKSTNHSQDSHFNEQGWTLFTDTIVREMERRGCTVRKEAERLIFENGESSREDSPEPTKLLSEKPSPRVGSNNETDIGEEAPTRLSFVTQPLKKTTNVRLLNIIKCLEKMYGRQDLEETSPLHGLLTELERFVGAESFEHGPNEQTDFYISCVTQLLKKTVNNTAAQLSDFITNGHSAMKFGFTQADFADLLLTEHMKRLKKGGSYHVVSDVASWRDYQLSEFRKQAKKAVQAGAKIQRVFNLMLKPHKNPMKLSERRRILEEHLKDSETWTSENGGKYEVQFIDRSGLKDLSDKMPRAISYEQAIESAHFGIFNDTNVQTLVEYNDTNVERLVEYEVKASDLSKMYLLRGQKDINDHLRIFGLIWKEESWLTQDAINRICPRKKAKKA